MIHGQNTYPSLHGNQNLNFFEIRPESCLIGRCRQTNFVPLVFCETIIRQLLVSHKKAQFLRLKTYCNSLSEKDYYEVYASHQKKPSFVMSLFRLWLILCPFTACHDLVWQIRQRVRACRQDQETMIKIRAQVGIEHCRHFRYEHWIKRRYSFTIRILIFSFGNE